MFIRKFSFKSEKCWNTCTLNNKIVGHLSALNNNAFDCILSLLLQLCTTESYLYLHDLCVFCVFYVYFMCIWAKCLK